MNRDFDWTTILPESERQKVLIGRQDFFDSFPSKVELEQAGLEGRAAFAKACAEVDRKKFRQDLHTLLADATDELGVDVVKIEIREASVLVDALPPCPPHNLQDGQTCPVCGCMGNGEG